MLFVVALASVYQLSNWKSTLVLITSFTIGHSLSLGLSVTQQLTVSSFLIELLIPVTILISAGYNLLHKNPPSVKSIYLIPLFFGLIHGLGFSFFLKSLLGSETSILTPLFSFNLGVEAGQIIIVFVFFLLREVILKGSSRAEKPFYFGVNGLVFLVSIFFIFTVYLSE